MMQLHALASPARFNRASAALAPYLGAGGGLLLAAGLYLAFFASPPDYQQGEAVRIMYIHVPCAWLSMAFYGALALAGASFLVWRHPLADTAAEAIAPVGAAFTAVTLITGALWGKPMWGTWWVWDARLTSVLILFFLYLGVIALRQALGRQERASSATAVMALIGAVNLPVIKFSVEWWSTLHQPASVLRSGGSAIAPGMLWPLLVMALSLLLLGAWLSLLRIQALTHERRAARLQKMQA